MFVCNTEISKTFIMRYKQNSKGQYFNQTGMSLDSGMLLLLPHDAILQHFFHILIPRVCICGRRGVNPTLIHSKPYTMTSVESIVFEINLY